MGSIEQLVMRMEWAPRLLRVETGRCVVVLHNGRMLPRVLTPGSYAPLFGLPLFGALEYIVFSAQAVWHSTVVKQARLRDGTLADLAITALVKLSFVHEQELLDWVTDFDTGMLAADTTMRDEFERKMRGFCRTIDYARARRVGFEVGPLIEEWALSRLDGFLDIVRIDTATLAHDRRTEARWQAVRPEKAAELRTRIEELAGTAAVLTPGWHDADIMHGVRVLGWAEHVDLELEALVQTVRDNDLASAESGALLTRLALALIRALAAARCGLGDERVQRAIGSTYAWELLRGLDGETWASMAEALQRGDVGSLVTPGTSEGTGPGRGVPWRLPQRLVTAAKLRNALADCGIVPLVAGCCAAPSPWSRERLLYMVSAEPGELRRALAEREWRLTEAAGADEVVVLPSTENGDDGLRAWFHAIVGVQPAWVSARRNEGGVVTLEVSGEVRADALPPAGVHALAEVITHLAGVRAVTLRQDHRTR